jgi:hypothetical protein
VNASGSYGHVPTSRWGVSSRPASGVVPSMWASQWS